MRAAKMAAATPFALSTTQTPGAVTIVSLPSPDGTATTGVCTAPATTAGSVSTSRAITITTAADWTAVVQRICVDVQVFH